MAAYRGELRDYLHQRGERALAELAGLEPDFLLSENEDVLVESLLGKHLPEPVTVYWDAVTRSEIAETTTDAYDMFDRTRFTVPASRVVITFPLHGTAELLTYRASRRYMSSIDGEISDNALTLVVVERTLDAQTVESRVDHAKRHWQPMSEWANKDLTEYRTVLDRQLRQRLTARKERLLSDRHLDAALDIPVRHRDDAPPPVPARPKHIKIESRKASAQFAPEPVLDEAHYQAILDQIRGWANSLERTPGSARSLGEEDLRNFLLGALNAHWEGAAAGELFNGNGKTDILIRHDDRNAFVGECKIWKGPKAASEALDQLLGYMVWRDSKAALIVFIRNQNTAAAIASLHEAVEAHPACVLTREGVSAEQRLDYVFTADEEGRRISVAVIPVVLDGDH